MFWNRETKRVRLAEIELKSVDLNKKDFMKLTSMGVALRQKDVSWYTPSSYSSGWIEKTEEERKAEGERLLKEITSKGLTPIYDSRFVVDITFFIDTFPLMRFEYLGPIYTRIVTKR